VIGSLGPLFPVVFFAVTGPRALARGFLVADLPDAGVLPLVRAMNNVCCVFGNNNEMKCEMKVCFGSRWCCIVREHCLN
jgi:hypothetical protein